MTDKEQRIFVKQTNCDIGYQIISAELITRENTMTRAEAVQAMVKAVKLLIAKKEFPNLKEECEAALDAICYN